MLRGRGWPQRVVSAATLFAIMLPFVGPDVAPDEFHRIWTKQHESVLALATAPIVATHHASGELVELVRDLLDKQLVDRDRLSDAVGPAAEGDGGDRARHSEESKARRRVGADGQAIDAETGAAASAGSAWSGSTRTGR